MKNSATLLPSLPNCTGFMSSLSGGGPDGFRRPQMISSLVPPPPPPGTQVVAHDVLPQRGRIGREHPTAVAGREVLDEVDEPGLVVEHEDVDGRAAAGDPL